MTDNESPEVSLESDTLTRVKAAKKAADKGQAKWREDARECYAFRSGEQWSANDKAALIELNRAPVVFNRIAPMVDSVAGSEVNNRQQVQYIPRTPGDSKLNEILTGAADYIRDQCNAEDEESDSFVDSLICGVGWTETLLDYVDDPEGQVLIERRDPMSMRWDPAAKKRNLSDRKWQQREEWLDREDIEAKWPDAEIGASTDWGGADDDGEETHDASLAWLYERDATGYDKRAGKYRVIHHQWFEFETYHQVLDPATGQIQELSTEDYDRLQTRAVALGVLIEGVKKQRKKYKQAFVCGDTVLEESNAPCNRFTYHAITAKRDRNANTWYGIVKAMLDPQRWANKFFSQVLHIINTNAKGGLMVEDGATDNMAKLKEEWSKSDSVVTLNDGAISGQKIMTKPVPQVPAQLENMLSFSISSLRDVSGINLEMLGMADRQQAGVLEAQRKQSAMTVLATLFDALRLYRKEQGKTLAAFIRDYMSDGRLIRIVQGDGIERYVPLVRDAVAFDYDVVVDEAATTNNNKERTFAMLMQMLPMLRDQGIPFQPELLEYLPLPSAMVEKWKQKLSEPKPPAPPSPQEVSAQANMVKAQAAMAQVQQDGQIAQAEMPIKMQELDVRRLEAQVAQLQAMVEGMIAQQQLTSMSGQGVPLGNGMPQPMPTTPFQ
jgi:hypothetical protein